MLSFSAFISFFSHEQIAINCDEHCYCGNLWGDRLVESALHFFLMPGGLMIMLFTPSVDAF